MSWSRTPSARKKRQIRRKLSDLPPRGVILFEDETDLLLFPPLHAAWARKGEEVPVPITGANAQCVVWGVLNIWTGYRLLWSSARQRAVDFIDFLDYLRWHFRGWNIALVLDGDSSHTAAASREEAEYLEIELIELPQRSPHLNPLDHLWRHAKEAVCANRQYDSLNNQAAAFFRYIHSLSPREALRKAGVLSDDFWLFQ